MAATCVGVKVAKINRQQIPMSLKRKVLTSILEVSESPALGSLDSARQLQYAQRMAVLLSINPCLHKETQIVKTER